MKRLVAAAVVLALGLLVAIPAALLPVASAAAPPGLTLVSETTVVTGSGSFTTRLHVDGSVPTGEQLQVTGYAALITRTGFTRALQGHPGDDAIYPTVVTPVTSLAAPGGDVVVTVPVDPNSYGAGPFPSFNTFSSGSAVYPFTFALAAPGGPVTGAALTGFLVYSTGPNADAPALSVSLTVPVQGPTDPGRTVTGLPAKAAASVAAIAGALQRQPEVPVTLAVSPDLVARLDAGDDADRATLRLLEGSVTPADELLAAPYFPLDLSSLAAAGLSGLAGAEVDAGDAVLEQDFPLQPVGTTAVVDAPVDAEDLAAAAALGAGRFVLPAGDLGPLPASDQVTTYARPAVLSGRGVPALPVVTTDPQLSSLLDGGGDRTLDARDVVAGLAMIELERPANVRGVAIEVPPGGSVDPVVLAGVLAGLQHDPFVSAVTADGLFAAVPAGTDPPGLAPVDTRTAVPLPGAAGLGDAAAQVQGLVSLIPSAARTVAPLRRALLSAASAVVGGAGRASLVAGVDRVVKKDEAGISLPGPTSVTITSRRGTIPLTVLSNRSLVVHVELRVASSKLQFLPFNAGAGRCRPTDNGEACPLVLTAEATTIRLPVESRTSGVFRLDVTLASPDGSVLLVTDGDTVRSTAFSGVGVVLIVLAGLGLVVWWVRDIRHGRRARQLVDPPTGETPVVAPPGGDRWVDDDPVVAEFFASPPAWRPASPSGPRGGPNS